MTLQWEAEFKFKELSCNIINRCFIYPLKSFYRIKSFKINCLVRFVILKDKTLLDRFVLLDLKQVPNCCS